MRLRLVSMPFATSTLLGLWPGMLSAQSVGPMVQVSEGLNLTINGGIQNRLTYGWRTTEPDAERRFAFGIRRARLINILRWREQVGLEYDMDIDSGTLQSVDLFAFYYFSEDWRIRMGIFPGPQPRAYILTSFRVVDSVERAAIAEYWARHTIGSSGRDFGFDIRYQRQGLTLQGFLHGGSGDFDNNFVESLVNSSATGGRDEQAVAVSGYVNYALPQVDGLEIGGFGSINASENPNTQPDGVDVGRTVASYSGHIYWGARPGDQPIRLKADVIGLLYEALEDRGIDQQSVLGLAATGAVQFVRGGEVFGRYEQLYLDTDAPDRSFLQVGVNFSVSARDDRSFAQNRFTLAYAGAYEDVDEAVNDHQVLFQWQLTF
ncbi:MAG: hypothetical protein AAF970_04485 [Bacteroidota bacterium]